MTKTMDDEDLVQTKTIFRRHSKGPVMFNGCSPLGDVIILDNISSTKSYDLTGWYIERKTDSQPVIRYTFVDQFVISPLTTVELWSSTAKPTLLFNEIESNQSLDSDEQQSQSFVSMQIKLSTWNIARQWSINRLFNSHGHEKAVFSHRILTPIEQEKEE